MIGLGRPSHIKSTRHPRQSSSAAYSVFDSNQIQTFREAFNVSFIAIGSARCFVLKRSAISEKELNVD